jgi:hypothetical protein
MTEGEIWILCGVVVATQWIMITFFYIFMRSEIKEMNEEVLYLRTELIHLASNPRREIIRVDPREADTMVREALSGRSDDSGQGVSQTTVST